MTKYQSATAIELGRLEREGNGWIFRAQTAGMNCTLKEIKTSFSRHTLEEGACQVCRCTLYVPDMARRMMISPIGSFVSVLQGICWTVLGHILKYAPGVCVCLPACCDSSIVVVIAGARIHGSCQRK